MAPEPSGRRTPRQPNTPTAPDTTGSAYRQPALLAIPRFLIAATLILAFAFSLIGVLGARLGHSQPVPDALHASRQPVSDAPREAPAVASSSVQGPSTIASSWSASPVLAPPAPAPASQPAAEQLARQARGQLGIDIVLDGQDWGPDEASRLANIGAVISAMERLPTRIASAVVANPHGPLIFLSNRQGRTLAGWQPYGDLPIGFYTNADRTASGPVPANQIVLIPGFADMSIGHEIMHAYQFRDAGPEQYALVMLRDEMRSFAQATGWRQVGSDDDIRATLGEPWEAFNALFAYEGRPLTYTTGNGRTATLNPPNPIEAFAVAGSIYYTRPSWLRLPDWPEYWAWFHENLGYTKTSVERALPLGELTICGLA